MRSSTLQKPARVSPVSIAPAKPASRTPLILLVVATLAFLWPACTGEFVWDDSFNISKNAFLNPPSISGILHFWAEPFFRMYIPVTYSVWGLLAMASAVSTPDAHGVYLNPYVFHAANLLLHVVNVLIVFRLLQDLRALRWAACAGAMLFALHPLQVEPVAWATGIKDVLSATFSLLALWQYVAFLGSSELPASARSRRVFHYFAGTVAFTFALLAKPSAVVGPLMALALGRGIFKKSWRELTLWLQPWLVLAAGCALFAQHVQSKVEVDAGALWQRPLLAVHALAFYLYKLVVPLRLAVLYAQSPQQIIQHHWLTFTWLVPAGISVVVWLLRRRAPWLWVSWALFVFPLLPVLGLAPFDFEARSLVADRYLYLAMLGPAMAMSFAISLARWPTKLRVSVCAVVLLLLGIRSFFQTWVWQSNTTLFHHAIEVNPQSALAYDNLAVEAMADGNLEQAAAMAHQSAHFDPRGVTSYLVLGDVADRQRNYSEALSDYRTACENEPHNPTAQVRLAGCFADHGPGDRSTRLRLATQMCRSAVAMYPQYADSRCALAGLLAEQNEDREAIEQAQIALNLAPNNAKMELLLGELFARDGRPAQAADHFNTALRLDPQSARARDGLAKLGKS